VPVVIYPINSVLSLIASSLTLNGTGCGLSIVTALGASSRRAVQFLPNTVFESRTIANRLVRGSMSHSNFRMTCSTELNCCKS